MLAVVPGCQAEEDGNVESGNETIRDDLFHMGLSFQAYQEEKNASPSGWDEFISFAEENEGREGGGFPEHIRRVRDAGYSVTWDLGIFGVDYSTTVLAEPPGGAGLRLMANGVVTEAVEEESMQE
jgi:hypothetical protein